jgi:hypothetical protein
VGAAVVTHMSRLTDRRTARGFHALSAASPRFGA